MVERVVGRHGQEVCHRGLSSVGRRGMVWPAPLLPEAPRAGHPLVRRPTVASARPSLPRSSAHQRKTLRANNDPPRPFPLPARIRRMTSGMVFGWGGLRDVWRIPAYVREVNADPKELRALENLQRAHPRPEFNPSHVSAMTSLGFWYYYLVGALASWILPAPAMPLAYACAAWAMGTAGWAVMSCGRRVACRYWITTGSTVVAAVAASYVPSTRRPRVAGAGTACSERKTGP